MLFFMLMQSSKWGKKMEGTEERAWQAAGDTGWLHCQVLGVWVCASSVSSLNCCVVVNVLGFSPELSKWHRGQRGQGTVRTPGCCHWDVQPWVHGVGCPQRDVLGMPDLALHCSCLLPASSQWRYGAWHLAPKDEVASMSTTSAAELQFGQQLTEQ